MTRRCFLAEFSTVPCDGRLIRAHLIPKSLMKREGVPRRYLADPRGWVWCCGGPMGESGHHGMLDTSRRIRIPRYRLPPEVEEMAEELGLTWWLDRTYFQTTHVPTPELFREDYDRPPSVRVGGLWVDRDDVPTRGELGEM